MTHSHVATIFSQWDMATLQSPLCPFLQPFKTLGMRAHAPVVFPEPPGPGFKHSQSCGIQLLTLTQCSTTVLQGQPHFFKKTFICFFREQEKE